MFIHLDAMIRIDHDSPIPLRAQVELLLRELVRQPKYQKGTLLPDEVALAAQLGISRGTVRSGISKLVFEGVLERKAGVGTRVSNRLFASGIQEWRSFTREMASKGITVENFQQDFARARVSAEAAQALQIETNTEVWRLTRVRGWDGKPVLRSTSWFHPRLGLTGKEEFTRPLYEVIEATTSTRPGRAHEEFLAVSASETIAKLLKVKKGVPLLLRRHSVLDVGGRPFEFAEVHYVSSRFALTLDMRRSKD